MKEATTNNYQNKYELIDSMNESIKKVHTIDSKQYDSYFEKYEYKYFCDSKKSYNNVNDFITDTYANITKGIVKKLCYHSVTTKNNKVVYPNYDALIDIIKKGYNDIFFDDISQEVALYMIENNDKIIRDNNNYDISNIIIDLFKVVRNYIYNNKLKLDKTTIGISFYNDDKKKDNTIALNSHDYKLYCIESMNDFSIESIDKFYDIIDNIKLYINFTEKQKVAKNCCIVLDLLIQGYKKFEISEKIKKSDTSITKYHDIIKNAYYVCYKKPHYNNNNSLYDIMDKYILSNKKEQKEYISISFVNCSNIEQQQIDSIIDKCNSYYHNEKQAMYNELFHALPYDNKSMVVRCKMVESFYKKELQLDRQF